MENTVKKKTTLDYLKELQELQLRFLGYHGNAWLSVNVNYELGTVDLAFHYEEIRLHTMIYSSALGDSSRKEDIDKVVKILRSIIDKLVPEE